MYTLGSQNFPECFFISKTFKFYQSSKLLKMIGIDQTVVWMGMIYHNMHMENPGKHGPQSTLIDMSARGRPTITVRDVGSIGLFLVFQRRG